MGKTCHCIGNEITALFPLQEYFRQALTNHTVSRRENYLLACELRSKNVSGLWFHRSLCNRLLIIHLILVYIYTMNTLYPPPRPLSRVAPGRHELIAVSGVFVAPGDGRLSAPAAVAGGTGSGPVRRPQDRPDRTCGQWPDARADGGARKAFQVWKKIGAVAEGSRTEDCYQCRD